MIVDGNLGTFPNLFPSDWSGWISRARPISRFQNTISPRFQGPHFALYACFTIAYFAIFILGWNLNFPTRIERILWQAASLTVLLSSLGMTITMQGWWILVPAIKRKIRKVNVKEDRNTGTPLGPAGEEGCPKRKQDWLGRLIASLRNNSTLKDPILHTPIRVVVAMWFWGFLYVTARIFIIVEDFMELRSLPANTYENVNWSSFWPHV